MFNKKQWGFCYSLGGDGSGDTNLATTTAIASLCSLVDIAQKEEKEKKW